MIMKKVFLLILLTFILNFKLYSQFNIGVGLLNKYPTISVGYDYNIDNNWSVGVDILNTPKEKRGYYIGNIKYNITPKFNISVGSGIGSYYTSEQTDHHYPVYCGKIGYNITPKIKLNCGIITREEYPYMFGKKYLLIELKYKIR